MCTEPILSYDCSEEALEQILCGQQVQGEILWALKGRRLDGLTFVAPSRRLTVHCCPFRSVIVCSVINEGTDTEDADADAVDGSHPCLVAASVGSDAISLSLRTCRSAT